MYQKISVTPAEMLEMRAEGMSNRDIANVLDISYSTVLKYIGAQDCRMDSFEAFKPKKKKKKEEEKEVETVVQAAVPKYSPIPVAETYRLPGMVIELCNEDGAMCMEVNGDSLFIPYENVPELVQFLLWAMRERMEAAADGQTEQVQEP